MFGLRSPIIHKTFQTKSVTSVVACVEHHVGVATFNRALVRGTEQEGGRASKP